MENNESVSISRRRALRDILGIPPTLLGLAETAATGTAATVFSTGFATALRENWDSMLANNARIFTAYHAGSGEQHLAEAWDWTFYLEYTVLPRVRGEQQQEAIKLTHLYLQYQIFVNRELLRFDQAMVAANHAIQLMSQYHQSTNTLLSQEWLAQAYLHRQEAEREMGDMSAAATDAQAAEHFSKGTSTFTRVRALIELGIVNGINHEPGVEHLFEVVFRHMDTLPQEARYYIDPAFAHMRYAQALAPTRQVDTEISRALTLIDPKTGKRREVILQTLLATTLVGRNEQEEAIRQGIQTALTAKAIGSRLNLQRLQRHVVDPLKKSQEQNPEWHRLSQLVQL